MKTAVRYSLISLAAVILIAVVAVRLNKPDSARGKSPAQPLSTGASPEDLLAQDIALSDPAVIARTTGRRSEVFGVSDVGAQYPASAAACAAAECRQVDIYNFRENELLSVIVNVDAREVAAVLVQPGILPVANERLTELAINIIMEAPEVAAELGAPPRLEDIAPMPSSLAGTDCGDTHPCLGATFRLGDRFLWAHVDLTTESLAGIAWSPAPAEEGPAIFHSPSACPEPGTISRAGWQMNHSVTPSDGLRLEAVTWNGVPVLTSAKLVEWHADYGSSGYVDATGCGGGGGGKFSISPFGPTQVLDMEDESGSLVGFEVVQDFRMSNWGSSCNYRYEQHFQFYQDGRFRIVGGAYGKGCGTNAIYRPLLRIDLAAGDDPNDLFSTFDGTGWVDRTEEFWLLQDGPYTPENYAWKVTDTVSGRGFHIEPGIGQFSDGGRGDDAYIYVVQHHPEEGDANMNAVGSCCFNDHRQGPHGFLNNESIDGENLVLWYVPQYVTDVTPDNEYCWTIQGGGNPITFPCFGGPMFHPFGYPSSAQDVYLPVIIKE